MNIFVGNLSHQASETDLNELFAAFGAVKSTKVIKDNYTGQARGFAFVEMDNREEAVKAIEGLNDTSFMGRNIVVNEARPKTSNSGGRGGNDSFSGGNKRFNRNF